jgi:NAD(P)-dependent dehydrogenase (short-subunit alcohol dehydrogenase family)
MTMPTAGTPAGIYLTGRTAIVTGASRGIGFAVATAYAAAGANVVLTSRKQDALDEAAAALSDLPGQAVTFAANAGDPDGAAACVATALECFGAVDILVNNAATNPYAGPIIDVDLPRWDKTFQVNVRGPLVWTQAVWNSGMRERGGTIINMASIGGLRPSGLIGVYNVGKAALIHLTKSLAAELGPGVRVNAIAPGLVKTDFARTLWEGEAGANFAAALPTKRLGMPDDIAGAALFLASDLSAWMTGETLVVDGGALVS